MGRCEFSGPFSPPHLRAGIVKRIAHRLQLGLRSVEMMLRKVCFWFFFGVFFFEIHTAKASKDIANCAGSMLGLKSNICNENVMKHTNYLQRRRVGGSGSTGTQKTSKRCILAQVCHQKKLNSNSNLYHYFPSFTKFPAERQCSQKF